MMRIKGLRQCLAVLCAAVLSMGSLAAMPASAEVKNLVSNSTFDSGTSGWDTYQASGGKASLTTENGKLALQIDSVGKLSPCTKTGCTVLAMRSLPPQTVMWKP